MLQVVTPLIEKNIPQLMSAASSMSSGSLSNKKRKKRDTDYDLVMDDDDDDMQDDENDDDDDDEGENNTSDDEDSQADDESSADSKEDSQNGRNTHSEEPLARGESATTASTSMDPPASDTHAQELSSTLAICRSDLDKKDRWKHADNNPILYQPVMLHFSLDDNLKKNYMKEDVTGVTIHNSYNQFFVESAPLFFCSPNGFKWISQQMNDTTLLSKLNMTYQEAQISIRNGMADMMRVVEMNPSFDKEEVFMGMHGFLRSFPVSNLFSFEEIDQMIFAEFGEHLPNDQASEEFKTMHAKYLKSFDMPLKTAPKPKSNPYLAQYSDKLKPGETPTGFNGYAEKLCIAAGTAFGLLTLIAVPSPKYSTTGTPEANTPSSSGAKGDGKQQSDTLRPTYKMASKYLASALHALQRLAFIGSSLSGVKGGTLLLLLFTCCLNFMPSVPISSIVVRLAQDLGMHRKESYEYLPENEAKVRLTAWWGLYALEKDICLKLGRPSHIFDHDISVPVRNIPFPFRPPGISEEFKDFSLVTISVELYRIWNRLSCELNSPSSASLSVKERLTKIVAYDKELVNWKLSLPVPLQPDSPTPASFLNMREEGDTSTWIAKHSVYYCHSTYYFILSGLHRLLASHPSWIYRVTRVGDNNKTEMGLEHFDAETVDSLLREVREDFKQGKPYESKAKNGIRLVTRTIALEYPRLLGSPEICIDCARKTIKCILSLHPWTYVPLWRAAFFGFNAVVTLFVNGIFTYYSREALNDLSYIRNLVEVFDRMFDRSKDYMHQSRAHNLMGLLADCLAAFIERKQRESKNKEIGQGSAHGGAASRAQYHQGQNVSSVRLPPPPRIPSTANSPSGGGMSSDRSSVSSRNSFSMAASPPSSSNGPVQITGRTLPPPFPSLNGQQAGLSPKSTSPPSSLSAYTSPRFSHPAVTRPDGTSTPGPILPPLSPAYNGSAGRNSISSSLAEGAGLLSSKLVSPSPPPAPQGLTPISGALVQQGQAMKAPAFPLAHQHQQHSFTGIQGYSRGITSYPPPVQQQQYQLQPLLYNGQVNGSANGATSNSGYPSSNMAGGTGFSGASPHHPQSSSAAVGSLDMDLGLDSDLMWTWANVDSMYNSVFGLSSILGTGPTAGAASPSAGFGANETGNNGVGVSSWSTPSMGDYTTPIQGGADTPDSMTAKRGDL